MANVEIQKNGTKNLVPQNDYDTYWSNQGWETTSPDTTAPDPNATPIVTDPAVINPDVTAPEMTEPEQPVYKKEEIKTKIETSLAEEGVMDKMANKAFLDGIFRYTEGRNATPEEVVEMADKSTVRSLVDKYGLGDLAPNYAMEDTETLDEGEDEKPKSIIDQIDETMQGLLTGKADVKSDAAEEVGLDEKSDAITTAETLANDLRTKIQTQQIEDIKEEDIIRGKPLLASHGQGELNKLSREQKLDLMITQQSYNNALVDVQIAQGNYKRANEIVKETADDWYEAQTLKLDYLQVQKGWKDEERERYQQEIDYERNLRLEGFTYLDGDAYDNAVKEFGVVASTFNQFFFKDPANGKIYLRPNEAVEEDFLSVAESKSLGVPFGTTRAEAMEMGITVPMYKPTSGSNDPAGGLTGDDWGVAQQFVADNPNATPEELLSELLKKVNNKELKLSKTEIETIINASQKPDELSDSEVQLYISSATDDEGNFNITKIPAAIRDQLIKRADEMGIFKTIDDIARDLNTAGKTVDEIYTELLKDYTKKELKEMADQAGVSSAFKTGSADIKNYIKKLIE